MAYSVSGEPFQIYLSSDGCLDTYPENSPSSFKIVLKNRKEFQNKNQKCVVGLARFAYDSSMYNLGENTGTYFSLLIGNEYVILEPKSAYVSDAAAAVTALNKSVSDSVFSSSKTKQKLKEYINFTLDSKSVVINLDNVQDFGISPMLRKLLGFHKDKKFKSEHFEFRKQCRDLLEEIADSDSIYNDLNEQIARAYSKQSFKESKFEQRNTFIKEFGLNIESFYRKLRDDLSSILQDIIKNEKQAFEDFVQKNYYDAVASFPPFYSFEVEEDEKRMVSIPSSTWTMIDFIICTVVRKSYHIEKARAILPDIEFNPNLFSCLYVYTNLIKPVDFNNGQYRLLDIVFLKQAFGNQNDVAEHQSTHFKMLEVDTINEIQIVITTSLGTPAPFIHGPVFVVLEFRRI